MPEQLSGEQRVVFGRKQPRKQAGGSRRVCSRRRESLGVRQTSDCPNLDVQRLEPGSRVFRGVEKVVDRTRGRRRRAASRAEAAEEDTLTAALNYATCLGSLGHLKELKTVMRRTLPVAKRILGENNETTLRMRWACAQALYEDPAATLDDLHEAVETAEETERIARRVFGSAHPLAVQIESLLRTARATLRAREGTPSGGA